jgi:hypothetical protein
MATCLYGGKK